MIHRLRNWEERLSALVARVGDRPFEYGQFDCGQFVRLAIEEMTGIDLGKGATGYCDDISAALLLRRAGADDMGALAEIIAGLHGIDEIDPGLAKRGDIVLAKGPDGPGLAVIIGEYALAPSRDCTGVGRVARENWLRAWSTEKINDASNIGEMFTKVSDPGTISFLIATLISLIISFAVSTVTGVISKAFTKKPKKSPLSFEDRTITIRDTIMPWQMVCGSARVGGKLIFFDKIGTSPTEDIWMAIEWAHHPSKAIDSIYYDDEQIFVNSDGSVEGTRNGQIEIFHHLGAVPETADVALKTAFPLKWTDAHRGDGITYSVVHLIDLGTNWQGTVGNISADLRGALWTDPRTGISSYTDNLAVVSYGLLMDENFGEGAPATEIDGGNLGAQANICDEEIILPDWSENWKIAQRYVTPFTVNTSTNVITIDPNRAFFTPDKVFVWAATTLAAPLVQQTAYFWRRITATTGTLHPTAADATNNTNIIDLTTTGTGTQRIVIAAAIFEMLGRETEFTVNTSLDTWTATERLSQVSKTLDMIATVQSTVTLPAPLVAGTQYIISESGVGTGVFKPLNSDTIVNLTTTGTGVHTMRMIGEFARSDASLTDLNLDTVRIGSIAFPVRYAGRSLKLMNFTGTPPAPLVEGQIVFMIPFDANNIRLAVTRADAEIGHQINLTSAGTVFFGFQALEIDQDEMLGATTGMIAQHVQIDDVTPAPLAQATDYYFIRRGRGAFQFAANFQDAINGINIELKPTNGQVVDKTTRYGLTLKRERRYTANGVIDTEQDTLDIEKALGACSAGTLLEPLGSGKWRLKVGAYPIPLGLLQLKDVRQGGQPELQCLVEGSEAATTVKGVYSSPLNFDHPSDAPAVSDPAFVEEDGGEERIMDEQLPFTNSKFMARRILQIDLRRKRMQRTLRLPVTLPAGFRYEYGEGVRVDLSPLPIAFDAEVAGWIFQTSSETEGAPKPSIDLILRETDPWIYR